MKDRMLYSQLKKRSLEREIKGDYLELLFVFGFGNKKINARKESSFYSRGIIYIILSY